MHINSSLPNLIGGVSQQPELLRLPSHMKAQENGYSTPSKGLSKRPSSIHKGILTGWTGVGSHKTIDYGSRGIFHVNMNGTTGVVKVATEAGVAKNLYNAAGTALGTLPYLLTATPETSLKVVKEADTTFIINTDITVGEVVTPASSAIWLGLIWVKAGNYGRTYSVTIPGFSTYSYTTPTGSVSSDITLTNTDYIATQLATAMTAGGVPGVVRTGSVITLTMGGYAGMTCSDGSGGTSLTVVYKSVRSTAELPSRNVANGFTVKVEGGDATAAGDHYLTYNTTDGVFNEVRNPVQAWGAPDPDTMPLIMVPYLDGFQIKPGAWAGRVVGDADTNPSPAFVGKALNDLYFFQDRMGFVSGEGYDLSEAGQYYNFMRTTVLSLLDSDPVSGLVSHPKVSTLRHAIPFNKRLLFFSDKAQFELDTGAFLTPKTVSTRQLTEFECSSVVRPISMGTSLYFPVDKGEHSAFYNFFVSGQDSLEDGVDISGHIPQYVPKNVSQMVSSPVNNLFVALSKDAAFSLYVYQFYQDGPQRLQSAWHKWPYVPSGEILSVAVVDTRMILLVKRLDGETPVVSCETIALNMSPGDYRLDRKFVVPSGSLTIAGEGFLRTTNMVFPYRAEALKYFACVTASPNPAVKAGSVFPVVIATGSTAGAVSADLTGCTLEVGQQYIFRATLGRLLVREQAGNGSAGVSRGRTQVGRVWVNYADAATFSIEVASEGRPVVSYKSTGRLLGTGSAVIGSPALGDGRFGCPVLAENTKVEITLVNDTPLPSSFLSVDWEGYQVSRGQHV